MSYSFVVEIAEDGTVKVPNQPVQHVPAGSFHIGGHVNDDDKNESLNVTRKSISGDSVVMAQVWHK